MPQPATNPQQRNPFTDTMIAHVGVECDSLDQRAVDNHLSDVKERVATGLSGLALTFFTEDRHCPAKVTLDLIERLLRELVRIIPRGSQRIMVNFQCIINIGTFQDRNIIEPANMDSHWRLTPSMMMSRLYTQIEADREVAAVEQANPSPTT